MTEALPETLKVLGRLPANINPQVNTESLPVCREDGCSSYDGKR